MQLKSYLLICLLAAVFTPLTAQELSFFESFTDHAVLQRDVQHPIWGWGRPERKVILFFGDTQQTAKADAAGRWEFTLPAQAAGGPHTIAVQSGRERATIDDVFFGDVYLLSGQSNMEWRLAQSDPAGERAATIADPLIRELKVSRTYANRPETHLPIDESYGLTWRPGTADQIGDFSGVGSYFAHHLREAVDVPIGLLHSSWGGSRIEPWMDADALGMTVDEVKKKRTDALEAAGGAAREAFRRIFPGRDLPQEDRGEALGWLREDFDDSSWPTMTLPTHWEAAGWPEVDGYFYFRRTIDLTEEQASGPVTLHLGPIDDGDFTYVNGQLVGSYPNAYSTLRVYEVAPGIFRPGENVLAIRVYDGGFGGGFSTTAEGFYLQTTTGKVPLSGDYRYNIGQFTVDAKPNQIPIILYNAMIAPLEGLPLSGVLWYQGESNAGPGDNEAYAEQMRGLIRQWRGFFSHPGTLPFYWVQLANFMDPPTSADEPGWAVLRQSQTDALAEPVTGMAVITDIGEADDIHPRNKWEVGRRLSLFALRDIYGRDVQADSPTVDDVTRVGDQYHVRFRGAPEGLVAKSEGRNKAVTGFTVQGSDGKWHFAAAVLSLPDKVIVSNPTGGPIRAIRYNWANNPGGNLFSTAGLPVNGFHLPVDAR